MKMGVKKLSVLSFILLLGLSYGEEDVGTTFILPTIPTTNITTSPTTSTTTTPGTTTTPTTTTIPINTTTSATTTPPSTTTTSSTTTPASTTLAPSTTTTVLPPLPDPKPGTWNVHNKTANVTCIIVKMAVRLDISVQNKTQSINVPSGNETTATGSCDDERQFLTLSWTPNNQTNTLEFMFERNTTSKEFMVSNIIANILWEDPQTKNVTPLVLKNELPEFITPLNMSYLCSKKQVVLLTGDKNVSCHMTISDTRLEAFHLKNGTSFSVAQDCDASGSPDIVPIAVGCALVGLVAVVLIAYLVGRRRSRARGYLSM